MMQTSAANRAEVRRAEKAAKLAEQNRREVIVAICGTIPGRAYLWEQLEWCHVFTESYDDNPQRMAHNEGQRSAGLRLLADIMIAAPEQFIQMMVEANGRRTATTQLAGSKDAGRDDQGSDDSADGDEGGARDDGLTDYERG